MKRKSREIEHRQFKRLETSVPLRVKLLGLFGSPPPIRTETRDVSLDGLSIELVVTLENGSLLIQEKEPIKLIPYLVLNEKMVELEITIPPHGEELRAKGRIIWYDFGSRESSFYLTAGIFLEEMPVEERKKWENFVKNIA